MVIRTVNPEEPLYELATFGALTPALITTSWQALENIRLISTKLPAYQSGTHPAKELSDLNDVWPSSRRSR